MSGSKDDLSVSANSGGCCGCVFIILTGIVLWALLFGVTVGGRHYGMKSCDTKQGVVIDAPKK